MKHPIIFLLLLLSIKSFGSTPPYRTKINVPNIKTLQAGISDEKYSLPIIELNSAQKIDIRFDEMSHESHTLAYKVIHCNADWTPSDLSTNEYLEGFTNGYVNNAERSVNTNYLYTHYQLNLPNDEMNFKISGNYVVIIYEDNEPDKALAQACFSIVEPKVSIDANIRSNTDIELNGRLQQLDFDVLLNGYYVRDPMTEIKTVVRQNNRIDNEQNNLSPNYVSASKLSYINNKSLIFEGGNEYHNFDISSVYSAARGVDRIEFKNNHYEVFLLPDKIQGKKYVHDFDVNGRFLINHQEAFENVNTEADYMYVHFILPVQQVFFDGQLFLGGEFNYNLINNNSRLDYDNATGAYRQTLLLKQGGYNYQYWFLPKGAKKASVERVDGSYWETKNEYTIYIYHRAWGERYDRLIGVKGVQ